MKEGQFTIIDKNGWWICYGILEEYKMNYLNIRQDSENWWFLRRLNIFQKFFFVDEKQQ